MTTPLLWRLVLGRSPFVPFPTPGHSMWDFCWTIWHWDRMILNTSFYPISIFPIISNTVTTFSYHQSHNITLPLNKRNLTFSVQEFQSVPVCVGSNTCNDTNNASVFKIVFYPCRFKLLGWSFGWTVCVCMKYMNEKWRGKKSSACCRSCNNVRANLPIQVLQAQYVTHLLSANINICSLNSTRNSSVWLYSQYFYDLATANTL